MHAACAPLRPKTYVPKTGDGRADKTSQEPASESISAGQTQPSLGRRHYLHPHLRGLALSGRGHRPVKSATSSAGCWPAICAPTWSSLPFAKPWESAARFPASSSTATGAAIWQRCFPTASTRGRRASKHVCPRQSLSQRMDRILHGHSENRNAPRRLLHRRGRRPHRPLRLHRRLYATHRIHSSLQYQTPAAFEAQLNSNN